MRKSSSLIHLASALLVITAHYSFTAKAAAPVELQTYTVGSLAGQLSVDKGVANYSLPISLPPGVAGTRPELAFTYSSGGGSGPLGLGWSINGLSAISRCGRSHELDGKLGGIDWAQSDRYCLDGQRLILVSGTYGADGSEYRTETDGIARIRAHGQAGQGPAWFSVQAKAGQTIEYGNTADARAEAVGRTEALAWAQNKITDAAGNVITYHYSENTANGEQQLDRIQYADNVVQFIYEPAARTQQRYITGTKREITQRLKQVDVSSGGTLVSQYKLGYQVSSATQRSLLSSITQCDAQGNCLSPVDIAWDTTRNGTFQHWSAHSTAPGLTSPYSHHFADVNGDGLADWIMMANNNNNVWVALSNGDGSFDYWTNHTTTPGVTSHGHYTHHFADVNGDNLADWIMVDHSINNGGRVALSNGDGSFDYWTSHSTAPGGAFWYMHQFADVNGDGLADWIMVANSSNNGWVALSNGDGSFDYWTSHSTAPGAANLYIHGFADVNGDGLADWIMVARGTNNGWVALSKGDGSFDYWTNHSTVPGAADLYMHGFADVNGDGLADWIQVANTTSNGWVALSRGDGSFDHWTSHSTAPRAANTHSHYFSDVNGDGLVDWIQVARATNDSWVGLSRGDGSFDHWTNHTTARGAVDHYSHYFADVDGDGSADWIQVANHTSSNAWVGLAQGDNPELVTSISGSLGDRVAIEYEPLTDPEVFTKSNGSVYPVVDLQVPSFVVARISKDNGLGGTVKTSYRYGGAKAHVKGRGFLGFAWDEATDESTGVTTRTEYRQDFPFVGMPSSVTTRTVGGTVLSSSVSTYANQTTAYVETRPGGSTWNYSTHFPYLSEKVEQSFELDGSLVSTVTTRQSGYDAYGNVGQVEVITSAGGETYSKVTTNTYDNVIDVDKWHLGRLREATVVHTHNDGSTETRKSAFNYDPVTGLLVDEIIEPDQPAYRQLTTYEYDAFGNKVKTHVSADGLTTRTTTSGYDPSGRFATNVENALGHSETRTFDPATGKALSLTGPNGLTTQWDYDNWGRVTRELRADGTDTTTTRAWVDGSDPNAPAAAYYQVTTQTSGSAPSTTYYDQLGRVIRKLSTGFDGRAIYQDTEYDAQGREARSSLPYFKDDPSYWVVNHYDAVNRVIKKTFDTGKGTVTTDISYQGLTTVETNTLGQVKRTTKNALGKVALVEEEAGGKLTYAYDAIGNLLRTHQHDEANAKVVTTELWYDVRGRKTAMQDPSMGYWTYTHNAFGELVSQTDAKDQTTTMHYDALGRMISRTEPEGQTVWTYDTATKGIGKLHKVEQFDSQSTLIYAQTHSYDSLGRDSSNVTTFDGKTFNTSVDYDANSRIAKTWGANGFETENLYNEHGYLVAKRSPSTQIGDYDAQHLASLYDEATTSAQAALDSAANLITQRDYFAAKAAEYTAMAGQEQTFAAGSPQLSNGRTYPSYTDTEGAIYLEASWIYIFVGEPLTPIPIAPTHYKLVANAQGQWDVTEITDTTWQALKPSLTDAGQQATISDFNGDGAVGFYLTDGVAGSPYAGLPAELVAELQAAAAASHQAATLLDTQIDNALALAEQLIVVAGSLADRLEQTELWVEASGADTLDAMLADPSTITWWRATSRDAAGRLTGHRTGNGLVTIADYDRATGQLNTIQSGFGYGTLVRQLDYVYDGLDNVLARHDVVQGVSETFGYDTLNRLTTSHVSGTIDGIPYQDTTTYAYDALGNLTYKSDIGSYLYGDAAKTVGNAGPHALHRAGSDDYVYDANGSITSGGGRTVTWSSFNKPTSFQKGDTVIQFHYGPNRNRYKKTVGGLIGTDETTLYLGKSYERIEKAGGEVSHKHFIYAEGQLAAIHIEHEDQQGVIDPTRDETRYLHRDALGSIDTITDGQGVIVERMGYSPYGQRRQGDWRTIGGLNLALYTNRGFTGHEHIDEVGLIHMNGRVYDPQLGRFLSADPYVPRPSSSQSYNRYSYTFNNPMRYTDPSGYTPIDYLPDFTTIGSASTGIGSGWGFTRSYRPDLFDYNFFYFIPSYFNFFSASFGGIGGSLSSPGDASIPITEMLSANLQEWLVTPVVSSVVQDAVSDVSVESAVLGGTASGVGGVMFTNGAMTSAFQYSFNQGASSKREKCTGRPCIHRGNNRMAVGISGSVTHPAYSLSASALNTATAEVVAPTGLSFSLLQEANAPHGAVEYGADFNSGLGARMLVSIDAIQAGSVVTSELSAVLGLGLRFYFSNDGLVGLGFAAGFGASSLTKPFTSKALNIEGGGSVPAQRFTW